VQKRHEEFYRLRIGENQAGPSDLRVSPKLTILLSHSRKVAGFGLVASPEAGAKGRLDRIFRIEPFSVERRKSVVEDAEKSQSLQNGPFLAYFKKVAASGNIFAIFFQIFFGTCLNPTGQRY
jgi:hypothetical protein